MSVVSSPVDTASALEQPASRAATVITWCVLVVLLSAGLVYGNFFGNVAIAFSLVAAVLVRDRNAYRQLLTMPHVWLLIAAFVLLAIPILVDSRSGREALTVFDFAPFILSLSLGAAFLRADIPKPAATLPTLALAGSAVAFGVAAYQFYFMNYARPGGWELSPIHFGDLAVISGFLSLAGFRSVHDARRFLYLAGPVLGTAAGALSGTRTALLVACAMVPVAILLIPKPGHRALRALALSFVLLVLIVGLALLYAPRLQMARALDAFPVMQKLVLGQSIADPTITIRLDQYQAALKAIPDALVFGHGWRNQVPSALKYMKPEDQKTYVPGDRGYIHNDLLSFTMGMGLFGALAWLCLMAYPLTALIWGGKRLDPVARYMVLIAWMGILLSGMSDVLFDTELTKSFYCFIPNAIILLTVRCTTVPRGGTSESSSLSPADV